MSELFVGLLGTFGTLGLLHVVRVVGAVVVRLVQCRFYMSLHAFFVFCCDTVGTYAFIKAAQVVMYLRAIWQRHVLHNFADNCFLLHSLLKAQRMRWCRKYSIGMSLKLETVRSVFDKDN